MFALLQTRIYVYIFIILIKIDDELLLLKKYLMLVKTCIFFFLSFFFFQLLYLESGFLSVAYLAVANLARIGISVHCQASARSQCLVRLLSQCWITGGHTIHPPIEGLLPPSGTEPTQFRNSPSKVPGLQVHATTPGSFLQPTPI